ncbi:hypothetical protein HPCPY6081_1063 [Helicobacter pylori CPY6081]|nr:hypothetical protein HPCPY6081_1063 [Helicobacter pylori CPY6081]
MLVFFPRQREHSPNLVFLTSLSKDCGFFSRNACSCVKHFLSVIHNPMRAVFRENNQIQPGQTLFDPTNHLSDIATIFQHLILSVESRHLIINYRYTHSIWAATNISMSHIMFLIF